MNPIDKARRRKETEKVVRPLFTKWAQSALPGAHLANNLRITIKRLMINVDTFAGTTYNASMRILSFNIHGWRTADGEPNLDAVTDTIAATHADIVGLNEVFYPRVVEGSSRPALEALAERLDMHFVFGPCLRWPAQDDMPADAYGNALLSRRPIIADAAHHLTPVEGKEQRGLLEARIVLADERTLTVYVTHLDHTNEDARLTQLRAARTWTMRDRNRPHLMMGDFNAVSRWDYEGREEAWQQLANHAYAAHMANGDTGPSVVTYMEKAGYGDAQRLAGSAGEQSFIPSTEPSFRIDYIFLSRSLTPYVRSARIWHEPIGSEASDHRPVLAEIDWDAFAASIST
jgi:endonuclease/exonuclease/phosphatase family metal-dependent hydrolase